MVVAQAEDDLESAAKTVYLMKDVFLMKAALKARRVSPRPI
jgi:hypothetical protein